MFIIYYNKIGVHSNIWYLLYKGTNYKYKASNNLAMISF